MTKEQIVETIKKYANKLNHVIYPSDYKNIASEIHQQQEEEKKQLLNDYTDFLLKNGYTDSDVYDEPPTAIDEFLKNK